MENFNVIVTLLLSGNEFSPLEYKKNDDVVITTYTLTSFLPHAGPQQH